MAAIKNIFDDEIFSGASPSFFHQPPVTHWNIIQFSVEIISLGVEIFVIKNVRVKFSKFAYEGWEGENLGDTRLTDCGSPKSF
jgi:hypothetical protein